MPFETHAGPLHKAAEAGNVGAIGKLLAQGVHLDAKDRFGDTPLTIAAKSGQTAAALELVERGADLSAADIAGHTALHHAAEYNDEALLRRLIEEGGPVDVRTIKGRTPLMLAAARGHLEAVGWLVFNGGADWDAEDYDGTTALGFAMQSNHTSIQELLTELGARPAGRLRFVRRTIMWLGFMGKLPRKLATEPGWFLVNACLLIAGAGAIASGLLPEQGTVTRFLTVGRHLLTAAFLSFTLGRISVWLLHPVWSFRFTPLALLVAAALTLCWVSPIVVLGIMVGIICIFSFAYVGMGYTDDHLMKRGAPWLRELGAGATNIGFALLVPGFGAFVIALGGLAEHYFMTAWKAIGLPS